MLRHLLQLATVMHYHKTCVG